MITGNSSDSDKEFRVITTGPNILPIPVFQNVDDFQIFQPDFEKYFVISRYFHFHVSQNLPK